MARDGGDAATRPLAPDAAVLTSDTRHWGTECRRPRLRRLSGATGVAQVPVRRLAVVASRCLPHSISCRVRRVPHRRSLRCRLRRRVSASQSHARTEPAGVCHGARVGYVPLHPTASCIRGSRLGFITPGCSGSRTRRCRCSCSAPTSWAADPPPASRCSSRRRVRVVRPRGEVAAPEGSPRRSSSASDCAESAVDPLSARCPTIASSRSQSRDPGGAAATGGPACARKTRPPAARTGLSSGAHLWFQLPATHLTLAILRRWREQHWVSARRR